MASVEEVEFKTKVARLERVSQQMSLIASELTRKAEEDIEAVAGEQFPIDTDLSSVKDSDSALDTLTRNDGDAVFGRLVRAFSTVCANAEHKNALTLAVIDIRIESAKEDSLSAKGCALRDGTFVYTGVFQRGLAGCIAEEQLVQELEVAIGARKEVDASLLSETDAEYEEELPAPPPPDSDPPPLPEGPRPAIGAKLPPVKASEVNERTVESSLSPLSSPRDSETTPLVQSQSTSNAAVEEGGGCCTIL
eukprot:TRINITY_DN8062_c0_g1_i1.p2 TRINITY_DN8062_c0_g1~~TRINITY_DN8062_c0_g1_i1.p2  ORF type:complete len:250 (+),score=82.21 TRINITY_DN8062_c0_g1_i1:188-937(+)